MIDGLAAQNASPYNGWLYAVYDGSGNNIPLYSVVSPAVSPLSPNFKVLWCYGAYAPNPATLYPTWDDVVAAFGLPN
jgi:hypothetical protein